MKNDILVPVKGKVTKVKHILSAKSPEILITVGIAGVVTAAVLACKQTLKLNETLENGKNKINETKESYGEAVENKELPEHKNYRKDICKNYAELGFNVAKLYAVPAVIGTASIATVFTSNNILRKRNATLVATCTAFETAYNKYRANVIETFGEEVDRDMRLGIKTQSIDITETTKSGKEKTTTKQVEVVDESFGEYSMYAKFYDESCAEWTKDAEYNKTFLMMRQSEANRRLISQGHLFLNEVYDMLGIPRTKAGAVCGWIYDKECPNGDNKVKFGITDVHKAAVSAAHRDFNNGYEPVILLDFNVDGVIIDKI